MYLAAAIQITTHMKHGETTRKQFQQDGNLSSLKICSILKKKINNPQEI